MDAVAGGTTEETIGALVSYNIFATASTFGGALESAELSKLRDDFDVGYVLAGSVRSADDRLRVTVRLMDTEVGTQLWTQTFDEVLQPGNARARAGAHRLRRWRASCLHRSVLSTQTKSGARARGPLRTSIRTNACCDSTNMPGTSIRLGHAQSLNCLERAVVERAALRARLVRARGALPARAHIRL